MVKKLFKHEAIFYARVMVVVYMILLAVAGVNRIIQCFESDSVAYDIAFTISCITYGICVIAALGFAFVMGIVRFYKNMFTAEGYLTLTLPVTPGQHIMVKAVSALCVEIVTFFVILLSVCVITAGEMLAELWKAAVYLLGETYAEIGMQIIPISLEVILLYVLGLFSAILLYYTFISIGQLFRKNRILAAVGAYFLFYILSQVVYAILAIAFSIFAATGALDSFGFWLSDAIVNYPFAVAHGALWIAALLPATGSLIEFVIIRRIITRKLNLE